MVSAALTQRRRQFIVEIQGEIGVNLEKENIKHDECQHNVEKPEHFGTLSRFARFDSQLIHSRLNSLDDELAKIDEG